MRADGTAELPDHRTSDSEALASPRHSHSTAGTHKAIALNLLEKHLTFSAIRSFG
jgi:hypothetical protein